MGEVLIINVSYLLEDGVELMMQYYYFDKYAGVRYDYFETDGIVNIFFSAMISFTLAVFNIFALSHLFVQDQIVSMKNEFLSLEPERSGHACPRFSDMPSCPNSCPSLCLIRAELTEL